MYPYPPTTVSPSPRVIFLDALTSYRKQTKIDISQHPLLPKLQNCNTPEMILLVLRAHARDFFRGDEGSRPWLNTTVDVLHAFSFTLGRHVGILFTPSNALLTAIGIFLKAVVATEALSEFFLRMKNFFQRLKSYTEVSLDDKVKDIIVGFMAEVLSTLAILTKHVKQRGLPNYMKIITPLLEARPLSTSDRRPSKTSDDKERSIQTAVSKLDKLIQDEAKLPRPVAPQLPSGVDMDEKRRTLLGQAKSWLSPPDQLQKYTVRQAFEGTTKWILENEAYKRWKASGSLLWISGMPGSGKSGLCSAIIKDIQAKDERSLMAYCFFDYRDTDIQTRHYILSSLLIQLSDQSNPCCDVLDDLYSTHHKGPPQMPSGRVLTECLKKMLSASGQTQIYIILDGLDESPSAPGSPSPREDILQLVEELSKFRLKNFRLCVSSRPEIDIRKALEPLSPSRISLENESQQKKDVIDFIKCFVNSDPMMQRWETEDKELVFDTLSRRADGMFRFASCQLKALRDCPPSKFRVEFPFPESLGETYERALLQIDKAHREHAHRLLQCLTVAIRPLSVEDLAEVLALDLPKNGIPKLDVDKRSKDPEQAVLSLSSDLIAIVNRDRRRVAQLSHVSLKDFLTSDRLARSSNGCLSHYHVSLEDAHTVLAQACLGVLLGLDGRVDWSTVRDLPLVKYAARHWIDHAQFNKNVSSRVQDGMKSLFDPTAPQFRNWIRMHNVDRDVSPRDSDAVPPEAGALYYATLCGFHDLADHLVKTHKEDVNASGGSFATPLHAACYMGHLEIADLLVDHRVNVNARDHDGFTPLYIALTKGHIDIVRLLVGHGAVLNIQGEELQSLLRAALDSGSIDSVQLLLKEGAKLDAPDDQGSLPIHLASVKGNVEIVKLLVDYGARVDARDRNCSTPLHLALANENLHVVEFLFSHGANIDAVDNKGSAPLHLASESGSLELVKLLFDHGARVNAQDNKNSTPLHVASRCGPANVVQFLLDNGGDLSARNVKQWTPLHVASQEGALEAVQCLLDNGGDINASNDMGWTPLHVASYVGAVDVVQCLLKGGADVNAEGNDGKTPLHLAKNNKKMKTVQILLMSGADVYARDNNNQIPLEVPPPPSGRSHSTVW